MDNQNLTILATQLAAQLQAKGMSVVTIESCTGGLLASLLTSLSGSSVWFDRGFVTYSNQAKHDQVGVSLKAIEQYGAVSMEVAKLMAEGGVKRSQAQLAVSITGIAGPTGGTNLKPVGTVYIAVAGMDKPSLVKQYLLEGNRSAVRMQSVEKALHQVIGYTAAN